MNFEIFSKSDVGKVRKNNEDAYFISDIEAVDNKQKEHVYIMAVLDGMGGIDGGELASFYAAENYISAIYSDILNIEIKWDKTYDIPPIENNPHLKCKINFFGCEEYKKIKIEKIIDKNRNNEVSGNFKYLYNMYSESGKIDKDFYRSILYNSIDKGIDNSNQVINDLEKRPGTTLTSAIFFKDYIITTNIGDSRAYCYSDNTLKRITKDHSYVQELYDSRQLKTLEEARMHPYKNIVTKSLGVGHYNAADKCIYNTAVNDIYIISSDGLHDLVSDDVIKSIIEKYCNSIDKLGNTLLDEALSNGGFDNITLIVAKRYE